MALNEKRYGVTWLSAGGVTPTADNPVPFVKFDSIQCTGCAGSGRRGGGSCDRCGGRGLWLEKSAKGAKKFARELIGQRTPTEEDIAEIKKFMKRQARKRNAQRKKERDRK